MMNTAMRSEAPPSKTAPHSAGARTWRDAMALAVEKRIGLAVCLIAIGLAYVANTHYAERQARRIETLQDELKALRSEYMTLSAELSAGKRQSQIAQRVDSLGLRPLTEPPYKLSIPAAKP